MTIRNVLARTALALALATTLAGCGIFKGGGHKPKTAVLGERIPVLASANDAAVDPSLADVPVTVPAAEANPAWAQPGGNAPKSMGNLALGGSPARAWSAHIPSANPRQRFAAAPVVADGRIYLIDTEAVVHSFDLKTGGQGWRTPIATDKKDRAALFGGGVSYEDGKLYATDGLGDAVAMEAATGKILWRKRPGGPLRGAPAVGGGNAYVVTQDNQIFALKIANGDVAWTESATLEAAGVFGVAAPAIAQGTVVAGFSSGELSALRYENGRVVWQDQLARTSISTSVASISDIDASPAIDNGRVYAIGQGGRMVAMDLTSGQRLWEINIGGIDTPWIAGDWVYVVTDEAKVLCIARETGKIRWITQLERWRNKKKKDNPIEWSGPVLAGGQLWLTNARGELVSVSAADGKIGATRKAGAPYTLAPVVVDQTMLLLDTKGSLTAWR